MASRAKVRNSHPERPLRVAIAGLGRIGWNFHARRLAKSKDYVIAAVNDPEPERRREAEAELNCPAYGDYSRMLREVPLDAVVIATPTHLHKAMTLEAFRRNVNVMLEKPMAVDASEAAVILKAAERHRLLLSVYQPNRLKASFQQAKAIAESGIIGRVCRVQIGMFNFSRRDDWQSLRRFGGGMLNNYGAHGLDQLLQIVGYEVRRFYCSLQAVATLGDADDAVKIVLDTRKGVIGDLDISQASAIKPYILNIWGTCGGLVTENENSIRLRYFNPSRLSSGRVNSSLASRGRKYPAEVDIWQEKTIAVDHAYEIDYHANFAAAIRGKAKIAVPPRETLELMRLIGRLRRDAGRIRDFRLAESPRQIRR